MKTITITGASDDLIEIGGDIEEEFTFASADDDDHLLLAVSDGTLLRIVYDRDGIWRIARVVAGSAHYRKEEGSADKDTNDVVVLEGEIKWVALATEWAK